MARKSEMPKINSATFRFNGDKKMFDFFMEGLIRSYLDSDKVPKLAQSDSVGKVEISEKTA